MQLAHPARDREADARASAGVVSRPEAVEDPPGILRRDAGAVVGHLEPPALVSVGAGRHSHGAVGGAVAFGVVEQVGEDLGQPRRVRRDGEAVLHLHGVPDPATARARAHRGLGDGVRHELMHVDLREIERHHSPVDPAEVEQVADEGAETLGLGEGGAQHGVVGGDHAVDEVLEQCLLGGEWGAQLVGHGGDELPPLTVGVTEVGCHGVEGGPQLTDLVGGGRGDAAGVVTRGHVGGRLGHLPQGGGHAPREPLGHAQCCRDGDRHGEPGRHPSPVADLRHEGGDDDADGHEQAELDLDRPDAVERAVGVHVRSPGLAPSPAGPAASSA